MLTPSTLPTGTLAEFWLGVFVLAAAVSYFYDVGVGMEDSLFHCGNVFLFYLLLASSLSFAFVIKVDFDFVSLSSRIGQLEVIRVCSHGCLASVACSWAQVFCPSRHGFRVVDLLHLYTSNFPLLLKIILLFDNLLVVLELVYLFNYFIDFAKDLLIIFDSATVLVRKDMFNVVFELLTTNGAYNMICSWLWLLDARWMLIFLRLLLLHGLYIVIVLLI